MAATKWPKTFPPLTPEQRVISDDFMKTWLTVLPQKYGAIERFNHTYPVRHAPEGFHRTLEIGAGLGEHLKYETLTAEQRANYHAVDFRANITAELKRRCPELQVMTGDCQERLDYPDGHFDRILAIHVLEHLPDLPRCVAEMYRLCDKQTGAFSIVIPCEGSFAYSLARKVSAQRIFEKKYRQPYKWFIEREHVNRPQEILDELAPYFVVSHRGFFPFPVPMLWCNLVIGLTLRPRAVPTNLQRARQAA